MATNPYAHHLAGHDPRPIIAATPGRLHQLCCELTPEQLDTPWAASEGAPAKWSPHQIVSHLADCELVFSFRMRQTLVANPLAPHTPALIQPFDQEAWATRYAAYDLPAALETFRAVRGWNVKLIGSLSAADFERPAFPPERGALTFQEQIETMAGHDLNHLQQIESVAAKA